MAWEETSALGVAALLRFLEGDVTTGSLSSSTNALALAGLYREDGASQVKLDALVAAISASSDEAKTAALIVRGSVSLFERAAPTEVDRMLRAAAVVVEGDDAVDYHTIAAAVKRTLRLRAPLLSGDRSEWIAAARSSQFDGGKSLRTRRDALPRTERWLLARLIDHAAKWRAATGGESAPRALTSIAITLCSNLLDGGGAIPPSPTAHDDTALVLEALIGDGEEAPSRVASLASSARDAPPALVRDCCALIEDTIAGLEVGSPAASTALLQQIFCDAAVASSSTALRVIESASLQYGAGDAAPGALEALRAEGFGPLEASILLKRYVGALPQPLIARAAADALVAAARRFQQQDGGATTALRAVLADEALVSKPARAVLDAVLRVALLIVEACEGIQDVLISRLSGVLLDRVVVAGRETDAEDIVRGDMERGRLMLALLSTVPQATASGAGRKGGAAKTTKAPPPQQGKRSWKSKKSVRERGSIFMSDAAGVAAALQGGSGSGSGSAAPLVYIEPTYMLKRTRRGGLAARWQRRWFVVTHHYLLYYTSEAEDPEAAAAAAGAASAAAAGKKKAAEKPRGGIDLRLVDEVIIKGSVKGGMCEFALVSQLGGAGTTGKKKKKKKMKGRLGFKKKKTTESVKLRAASEHQARRWCAGLQQRVERAKATMSATTPDRDRRTSFFVPQLSAAELERELGRAESGLVGDADAAGREEKAAAAAAAAPAAAATPVRMLILTEASEDSSDVSDTQEEEGDDDALAFAALAFAQRGSKGASATALLDALDALHDRTVAHRDDLMRLLALAGGESSEGGERGDAFSSYSSVEATPPLFATPVVREAMTATTPLTRAERRDPKTRATLDSKNARLRRKVDGTGASSQKRGTFFGSGTPPRKAKTKSSSSSSSSSKKKKKKKNKVIG